MTRFPILLHRLAAVSLLTVLAGCGKKEEEEASLPEAKKAKEVVPSVLESRGFFNPKPEEAWVYRVTREVPATTGLSDKEALRVVAKHDQYYELVFERTRVCRGTVEVGDDNEELILIDIFEDGELAEQEYYEINAEGLFGRGWSGKPGQPPIISSRGIPIAIPGMKGGKMWRTSVRDSPREFKFRVIDRTTLDLPAGTFDVAQVQITSGSGLNSLKRTLWFAENVGIVKEITTYYNATSIRVRESSELVAWKLAPSRKAVHTTTPEAVENFTEAATTGPLEEDANEEL